MSLNTGRRQAVAIATSLILSAVLLSVVLLAAEAAPPSGYLGIGFSIDSDSGLLTVRQIVPDSPAESADILVADEILKVDEEEIRFPSHRAALEFFSKHARAGVALILTVRREGVLRETRVVPEVPPPSLAARNERACQCADGDARQ